MPSKSSKKFSKSKSLKKQRGGFKSMANHMDKDMANSMTNHMDKDMPSSKKNQKGGFDNHMTNHMDKDMPSSKKNQKGTNMSGGSPASSLVMEALTGVPVMNDNIANPLARGSGDNTPSCQTGGSSASDMVTANLPDVAQTDNYSKGFDVKGDINSLKLYAPSGGSRKKRGSKGRKNKSHSKSKKNKSRKSRKSRKSSRRNHMMRGGSDWISSQYSLGSINGAGMNTSAGDFSASQGVDRNTLMNPPTMGLAGSGTAMGALEGANVRSVGAPLV